MAVRMAHKLSKTVIMPTNILRASAKLAFSLFSDSTVAALKYHVTHDHPEWAGTYNFLSFVTDLVKICNIRSQNVGKRTRDDQKTPFYSVSDSRLTELCEKADFFKKWRSSKKPGLSSETFTAVENLCKVVYNLIVTLLSDFNFRFVLTGFLQSDPLESRFGRFRQMSGGNFFISVKQIIQSEKKIRLSSILHHSGISLDRINVSDDVSPHVEQCNSFTLDDLPSIQLKDSELQIVYFVAGYCSKRVQSRVKCTECLKLFICDSKLPVVDEPNDFFSSLNRGGLRAPANEVFVICYTAYEIFCRIKNSNKFVEFLRVSSPRSVFISTVFDYLIDNDMCVISCTLGHNLKDFVMTVISVFFNCLARNFVRSVAGRNASSDQKKIVKLRSSNNSN